MLCLRELNVLDAACRWQGNAAYDLNNGLYRILTVLRLLSVREKIFVPEIGGGVKPRTEGERCKAELTLNQMALPRGRAQYRNYVG
jgi:hypothetical protein